MLRVRANFLLYLTAWGMLGIVFGGGLMAVNKVTPTQSFLIIAPLILSLAFLCLSPWYSCRSMPLDVTPASKIAVNHSLAAIVAGGIMLLIAKGIFTIASNASPELAPKLAPVGPFVLTATCVLYLLSIAFHYAVLAVESSRKAELLARDAELRALKAQVNPHFLFNCLNSISALTSVDAGRAREMCIRLSEFLRSSLRLGERPTITFGEEWELARTYLDVEQVRFGERLRVKEEIDGGCAACEIPPLLVQPLVENAVKHGIATLVDGGEIAIRASRAADGVRLTIENGFDPEAPRARRTGIGLRNVRERLKARYGGAGQLEVSVEGNRYRVVLSVPCDEGAGGKGEILS